jgi:hypothetical protein
MHHLHLITLRHRKDRWLELGFVAATALIAAALLLGIT